MKFGIDIINAGHFGDPRNVVEIAQAAEAAGWDGFFIWDHLAFIWNGTSADPWVTLAGVAASTEKILIGPMITPVARRRPHMLAQHLVSLDLLSSGRVIFGAGLGGVAREFTAFGQPFEPKEVAAMLDEGLEVMAKLWTGEPVNHHGTHYTVDNVTFQPKPTQRIPIWIGGESEPAARRAARWDGWIVGTYNAQHKTGKTLEQFAVETAQVRSARVDPDAPFNVAVIGDSEPERSALVREYEQAGATWWLESIHEQRGTPDKLMERVKAGPPLI